MLTSQELRLRTLLRVLSLIFGLAVFGYLLPALVGPLQAFYVNLPFVTNSVVKIGVLALLALFASGDVRKYRLLILMLIAGHWISELATAAVLIWGNTAPVTAGGTEFPMTTILLGSMILDGVILVLLTWFARSAEASRYTLQYLSPRQFRTLTALAEVVIAGDRELLSPEQVARNVDNYLGGFRARTKWIMKLVLTGMQFYPLLSFRPPLTYIRNDERLTFIKRRFYQEVTLRLIPPFWRSLAQGMIRMGKQLCYLGYYSDPATFASVGYVPFSQRPDTAKRIAASPIPERKPLRVQALAEIVTERIRGDVVIVGSGAAASVLAHGLAKAGRSVIMLERGDFVDPSQFTEDEVDMISRLYADGALQLSRDFRFQVLQGSCVGGTTVVNNAVCFDLPPEVLDRWNDLQSLKAGLDPERVWDSFKQVRELMQVERQDHRNLNKGSKEFLDGLKRCGYDAPPDKHGEVDANVRGCLGCGYCNIGCKYGKKLSMLDTVLPMTQAEFGTDALRIIAGCEATRFLGKGKKVTGVRCRLKDGRLLVVEGNTVIVAAGAISSSLLLLRSGIADGRAGQKLSFNLGSPMTAVFDRVLNAYDGLQISHYLALKPSRGFVIETWFNPPVAQALTMPGWFEDHFNNMMRYNRMTCTGVLVGTESNGVARVAGLTGRDVEYTPTRGDFSKLLDGLILSGEIFLEAGASCVIPNTFTYMECRTKEELRRLPDVVRDASDITLGTGHPQGGNVLSTDPARGVVDPDFKVYGYDNLFVCDASVFPSSIGVNPQLTVMALAHYAAPFIANAKG